MNKNDLAKMVGLKTYDNALPIDWCYDVKDKTGYWPGDYNIVWSYDSPNIWGVAYALDSEAQMLLNFYNAMVTSATA